MRIRSAGQEDIPTIRAIAHATWPVAYRTILSPAQLAYMLDLMYSEAALREQMVRKGHLFLLAEINDVAEGLAGFEHAYNGTDHTRLHKLYTRPQAQGKGVGKALLGDVAERARQAGATLLELNVNRFNPAKAFYLHQGFRVVRDEVLDIGQGYVMDDHVMELGLGVGG